MVLISADSHRDDSEASWAAKRGGVDGCSTTGGLDEAPK